MTVDELYTLVTEAILLAEEQEAKGATADAEQAYFRVSVLEEEIADLLGPQDEEGAIARRGVVSAALSAGVPTRAVEMARRYIAEPDAPQALVAQLEALAAEAQQALPPQSDPHIRPQARVRLSLPAP